MSIEVGEALVDHVHGVELLVPQEAHVELEARAIAGLVGSPDGQEGLHAFLDKRKPQFSGR